MRIDQLPVASAIENADTLPFSDGGTTKQISVGNLTNSIRDNVYGAPLTASTSSAMTDTSRVYVYTGTTGGGFTNGHWYYYNGSAWTDGGVYNSSAVQTDTTLTLAGVPADAKATGELKAVIDDKLASFDVAIETFYPHSGGVGNIVTVEGTVDAPPAELIIYGKSVQNGIPTPAAPVSIVTAGSGGTLTMVSVGKNLAYMTRGSINYATGAEEVNNQATRTGFISVMGPRLYCTKSTAFASGSAYSLNARCYAADFSYIGTVRLMDGEILESYVTLQYDTTLNQAAYIRFVQFYPDSTTTPEGINLMIAFGDTSSVSYPEYVMASSISADIDTTPNGLPGIPVASGGNYTDTDGQEWICDTIDMEAGTWTKRCGIVSYNGQSASGWERVNAANSKYRFRNTALASAIAAASGNDATVTLLCTYYPPTSANATWTYSNANGIAVDTGGTVFIADADLRDTGTLEQFLARFQTTPMTIVYPLAAPVVNQLTDAQITALRALRGRKGLTNLYSADPAGPEFRAEMYIDIPTYINSIINQRG